MLRIPKYLLKLIIYEKCWKVKGIDDYKTNVKPITHMKIKKQMLNQLLIWK